MITFGKDEWMTEMMGSHLSIVNRYNQQSTINNQQSTINNQQSTINNQQSTIRREYHDRQ